MKFNRTVMARNRKHPQRTANHEGGEAFALEPKTELYQRVATCLVGEPKFYTDGDETIDAIKTLVQQLAPTDPEFALKLAVYARQRLHLRSVPIMLLGESVLNRVPVRKWVPDIIQRADEMSEVVSYLQHEMGDFGDHAKKGMLPNGIRRGLADVFGRFDEYGLQKYESRKGSVKLRDVLRLTHPRPANNGESLLWRRLKEGRLAIAETWETVISTQGSTTEQWEAIAPKMPIMALLRNIRNMLDKNVSASTIKDIVCAQLQDKEIILKSKQFPFRFLSAYRAVEHHKNSNTKHVLNALETACDISVSNLPRLPGKTSLYADLSGSMDNTVSGKSDVNRKDIACIMLAIADRLCDDSITSVFAEHVGRATLNNRNGVIRNTQDLRAVDVGGSTETYKCLESLKEKVDRVIIFTDEESYGDHDFSTMLRRYRQSYNPKMRLYIFNLAGYGTSMVPEDDGLSLMIAGWSERVLEYINIHETEHSTALAEIEAIEPKTYEYNKARKQERITHQPRSDRVTGTAVARGWADPKYKDKTDKTNTIEYTGWDAYVAQQREKSKAYEKKHKRNHRFTPAI